MKYNQMEIKEVMKCKKCNEEFNISERLLIQKYLEGKKTIGKKCSCGEINNFRIFLKAEYFQEGIDSEIEIEDEPMLDEV